MVFGPTLIILAGVLATASLLVYALAGQQSSGVRLARGFYAVVTALVTAASAYLMYLFVAHRFEFHYVFAYSSLDLPLKYTISSFWGGQEGTFLLWLLCGTWLGWTIITRAKHYERWTMVYYLVVQIFLIVLLVVRTPFAPTGIEAADGRGLNPLLQNPWMVIHPPIVFLGFAVLALPFAYALASLTIKDYASFPRLVFPWATLSVVTLGAGTFLGGYWAYKTLGWGGYWGWDPVENSLLIPWIISVALLHGLLLQRRKSKLVKTNLFLAMLSLLLVVYGTFLTRSGVLADFSVHSFTDLGINAYLVGFILLLAVFCPGLLLWRSRSIKTERLDLSLTSRDFGLIVGILLLLTIGFLICTGTSAPLLTRIFGDPANVSMSYYHAISIPSGIFLLLLLVIIPFTLPGGTSGGDLVKKITWPAVAAAALSIGVIIFVDLRLSDLVLIFLASGALGANIYAVILLPRVKLARLGGYLAHLGFAVMVLGIVASSNYDSAQRVSLITGVPETVMGYEISYRGAIGKSRVEEGYLELELVSGGRKQVARPKMYFSDFTQSVMRSPHVIEGLTQDLYLSPVDLRVIEEPGGRAHLTLVQGKPEPYGNYTFTFDEFSAGDHAADRISVSARLTVTGPDDTVTVSPQYVSGPGSQVSSPEVSIPGTELKISLTGILVESRSVHLHIDDLTQENAALGKELLTLDVSRKPLMSLVWLGVAIITLGSLVSFSSRSSRSGQPTA